MGTASNIKTYRISPTGDSGNHQIHSCARRLPLDMFADSRYKLIEILQLIPGSEIHTPMRTFPGTLQACLPRDFLLVLIKDTLFGFQKKAIHSQQLHSHAISSQKNCE